jgi:D-alanyl-D-alanine carboxypeptidase/D-alanyl-D-alanine-endopeptidase (penicillin-binding protein 4)
MPSRSSAPAGTTGRRSGAWVALLVFSLATGCAARRPAPAAAPAPVSPQEALRRDLDAIFLAPRFEHALFGVKVQSLASGDVLYGLNPSKLMMPASNMKLVTLAAAAARLGWDHRFETRLVSAAAIEDGVLKGDLVVIGGGDPSINGRGGDRMRVFDEWAARLRSAGITAIEGRLVGDDDAFEDETLGMGWSWDDLAYGFAAPVGALQFNEDLVDVVIAPGTAPGEPASVEMEPGHSGLAILNGVTTVDPDGRLDLSFRRLPSRTTLEVTGTVPLGAARAVRTASVDNPTGFFVRALRERLIQGGIDVRGPAVDIDDLSGEDAGRGPHGHLPVLVLHQSAPLADIAIPLMKVSQNLYADTLLKSLGLPQGTGSVEAGRAAAREALQAWAVSPDEYLMADGSGLSRYNYVTPAMLVKILVAMYGSPGRDRFVATLPVGGVDGSLENRMKGLRAEGAVRAKTGSLSNVRSLSGYVPTADGEMLAFSIIANHFIVPPATVLEQIDLAVDRLARFTRSPD